MVASCESVEIWRLKKFYIFRGEGVEDFLFMNSFLVDLLYDIQEPIKNIFGDSQYILYVDDYLKDRMILRVFTDESMDEDEEKIFLFDRLWWKENLYKAREKLCITA